MATQTITPNPMDALLAMQAQIAAMLESATAPMPTAQPVAPAKRSRKAATPAPVTTPQPAVQVAPVVTTAPNGVRVDLTDPYRKMVAFTHTAITKLRAADGNKSKGIHSVYSGFNAAFGLQFTMAKETVWQTVDMMATRGDIGVRWAKGGKMLYLPGEQPAANRESAEDTLRKILG